MDNEIIIEPIKETNPHLLNEEDIPFTVDWKTWGNHYKVLIEIREDGLNSFFTGEGFLNLLNYGHYFWVLSGLAGTLPCISNRNLSVCPNLSIGVGSACGVISLVNFFTYQFFSKKRQNNQEQLDNFELLKKTLLIEKDCESFKQFINLNLTLSEEEMIPLINELDLDLLLVMHHEFLMSTEPTKLEFREEKPGEFSEFSFSESELQMLDV